MQVRQPATRMARDQEVGAVPLPQRRSKQSANSLVIGYISWELSFRSSRPDSVAASDFPEPRRSSTGSFRSSRPDSVAARPRGRRTTWVPRVFPVITTGLRCGPAPRPKDDMGAARLSGHHDRAPLRQRAHHRRADAGDRSFRSSRPDSVAAGASPRGPWRCGSGLSGHHDRTPLRRLRRGPRPRPVVGLSGHHDRTPLRRGRRDPRGHEKPGSFRSSRPDSVAARATTRA